MISRQVEESIIQKYIDGYSRDEIARETGASTGSVSNTVNEWKRGIEAPDIEELRRIAVNMRKSGITIENDDTDSDLDSLGFFVNEIYKNVMSME